MIARLIATFCYVGYMRPAPGTWGSLAALPVAAVLIWVHPVLFFISIPIAFAKGWWATAQMSSADADPDRQEIVVDEVIGVWIALLPVVIGALHAGASMAALYPGWIAAFLAFRLFDIWKPGPIGWADRLHSPLGVMLDDVFAGIAAAISVMILAGAYHAL